MKKWLKLILGTLLIGGLVGYGAICGLVYTYQDQLTYFPTAEISVTPSSHQLEYEDFDLDLGESSVTGWIVRSQREAPWVIHFHGNGGNISNRIDHLKLLHQAGVNAVVFDYRGYGKSRGTPSEAGLIEDGLAVRSFLVEKYGVKDQQFVYFGESLGGGVACGVAKIKPPERLLLKSTFTSVTDRGAEIYSWLPVRALSRTEFANWKAIPEFHFPLLVIHGKGDEIIPFHHGEKLYELANQPKQWLEIPGSHNTSPLDLGRGFFDTVEAFCGGASD